jgi:hypothetical protein
LAYSIIAGNIISNPIGEICFSSVAAATFDSIKKRPAKKGISSYWKQWRRLSKKNIRNTIIHLFFTNTPLL